MIGSSSSGGDVRYIDGEHVLYYVNEAINLKGEESSYTFEGDYIVDGYYTDSNGNWKEFGSEEENYEYTEEISN